ncbi:MAG: hypothetical protein M1825_006408 [Sarcosagium campestre]|nr:MAG: hypothetical protein M1825_006408 [Sarcosagium campestre]
MGEQQNDDANNVPIDSADKSQENLDVENDKADHDGATNGISSESGASGLVETNGDGEIKEGIFALTVKLPHAPYHVQIMVSTQEQVQDLRQSIVESPDTFQYTCFHLEHRGKRVNDFIELSDVKDFSSKSELTLVEDPYTEKDARLHLIKVRDLVGTVGDRTDVLFGVEAGITLYDSISSKQSTAVVPPGGGEKSHAMSDYDFEAPASLDTLLPMMTEKPPRTLKSISVSAWNPPPYHFRQKGHLLYLQFTTQEGEQFQVTSTVSGFFVNRCTNSRFDPGPKSALAKDGYSHSLLTLISSVSPSFSASFAQLQSFNNRRDPLATVQLTNAIPTSPWLVAPYDASGSGHQADMTRSQESYLIAGMDNSDTLRDWNEEFQSTRELPRDTVQERVFRERLTSRLFADYNDAAARGAILVARGEVPPLNPTEDGNAQIFVYNNIFFSFGADGVDTFTAVGGDEAARVAVGKDVLGVRAVNQADIPGLFTPATVVVDYLGKRLVGQSIVPGIFKQRDAGENQIDYGGVEGKDVVATNDRFAPLFKQLSQEMRVKAHPVWDKAGARHDLEGSVETKGLLGTDGRRYVLDLYRITPLDVSWIETYWRDDPAEAVESPDHRPRYPHRMAVLRPELVEAFWKLKLREHMSAELGKVTEARISDNEASGVEGEDGKDDSKKDGDAEQRRIDVSQFNFCLNPDAFSGQEPQSLGEKEEWAKDEADVRAAGVFLTDTVIPDLIQALNEGDVGLPMDGHSLSKLLHRRGINVRYLGRIASLSQEKGSRLTSIKEVAVREMVSRAFKHVVNRQLRNLPAPLAAACLSHVLNCLFEPPSRERPVVEVDECLRALYSESDLEFSSMTPEEMHKNIREEVAVRFRFDLDQDWIPVGKEVQLLREIALKLGLQLQARTYKFHGTGDADVNATEVQGANGTDHATTNGGSPQAHGGKKKKKGAAAQAKAVSDGQVKQTIFEAEDIVNFVPLVKEASPKSVLADEALEAGRLSIAQNQRELGQDLLLESLSLHEQIYGILHPEVARFYSQLAMIYFHLDEKNAAVELARKAVVVSERTIGLDSAETILCYLNLALFEHASSNTAGALVYIRHALELWKVIYGTKHPDSITTINNAAVMLQALKHYHDSRVWFEASLSLSESIFGRQSSHTATLLFQLAQALALDNESKGAVNCMREAYNVFLGQLGADDKNTQEAGNWLEQLTQNAVSIAKHTKDLQARRLRRINLTPRINVGTKPQPQAGESAAEVAGTTKQSKGSAFDSRSVDELMRFIEGGGDASSRKAPAPASASKGHPGRNNPKRRGGAKVVGAHA